MDTPQASSSTDFLGGIYKSLFFFSNKLQVDHANLFRSLHQHGKDKRHRFLECFLNDSRDIIRSELRRLPSSQQRLIKPFDSILSLAADPDWREGSIKTSIEAALLISAQIASLLGHFETADAKFADIQAHASTTGLSIGLFSAIAVAVSESLTDIVRYGVESVRLAFRLGYYVSHYSEHLSSGGPEAVGQSWAYVVVGLSADDIQREIDLYNGKTHNTELTRIFISAADSGSVNVTGPPPRLKEFFQQSATMRRSRFHELPVYEGLCHGKHLFSKDDFESVIDAENATVDLAQPVRMMLFSSANGKPFKSTNLQDLQLELISELMTGSVHLDTVKAGLISHFADPGTDQCEFFACGECQVFKSIVADIRSDSLASRIWTVDLITWTKEISATRQPRSYKDSKLAVVGMSCRLPGGADDNELFWKLMVDGRDTLTTVPADRFDLETHYDPTGKTPNATQTPYGNFIDRPGLFDPQFFNMSPREAEQTDPAQRLALVTAYEALEMAGYVPNRTPSSHLSRVGTYYGQASDDWRELNASQNIGTYIVTGGVRAFGNGRINYFFHFTGPSINIDTACSSGLAAVQAACSALWAGEADTVVAGGLNIITDPDNYCGLSQAHFLSKTGQCKVWDKTADGYCRSDGIGSVVIKRLEDAIADNDNIIATVLAGATNHSADAVSITHPHAGNQKANYEQVMNSAGVDPLDVSYIELHGTGTQAGDATESNSVTSVFAPLKPRRRADQPLLLGSVKSNIGHGEAAAGIASFMKVLLMYQKNHIPPHIGIKTEINPTIPQDLDIRNAALNQKNTAWLRIEGKKRYSVVNSFGAHGGNTTMLLEDAPERTKSGSNPRKMHPITVSAKSKASLQMNVEALLQYVNEHPNVDLGDLSYTTCARRIQHPFRFTTVASDQRQLQDALKLAAANDPSSVKPVPVEEPQVIFTFTGQGSIYNNVSAELMAHVPLYRRKIRSLDAIVRRQGFPSILPFITGESAEKTVTPTVSQLAVLVIEIALANLWADLGVTPHAVIGHSLGEYAALVTAGVLSAADAIALVGKRAHLIEENCRPGEKIMLSIRANVESVAQVMQNSSAAHEVLCINDRTSTVIGVNQTDVAEVRARLQAAGLKNMELDLPFAFHSAQLDPILDSFEQLAQNVTYSPPTVPIISPLLKTCIFDSKSISANYLRRACREPVDFVGAVEAARSSGVVPDNALWIDVGPHPVSSAFVKNILTDGTAAAPKIFASLRRGEDNFDTIAHTFAGLHAAGVSVRWDEYFMPFERSLTLLHLPKYRWNEKNYWLQYTGTWTLDKAYAVQGGKRPSKAAKRSALRTPFVHHVISEQFEEETSEMAVVSDLMHPEFKQALNGHKMNGHGVAATCLWMDVALTLGQYMYERRAGKKINRSMNLVGMEVHHPQVANRDQNTPQLVQYETKLHWSTQTMELHLYNVDAAGNRSKDHFGSGSVQFEDSARWEKDWNRVAHMVNGRIGALNDQLATGALDTTRLSTKMAYSLFKKCVDYAPEFHGMQSVVLNGLEAYADVSLIPEKTYNSHTPPHWIDSVVHLAGLIVNGSDAVDNDRNFFVTPEMSSYRISRKLEHGRTYRSYVRMFPIDGANNEYIGDVYILDGETIIGMVDQIKFKGFSRSLLDFFFSPADAPRRGGTASTVGQTAAVPSSAVKPVAQTSAHALPLHASTSAETTTTSAMERGGSVNTPQAAPASKTAAAAPAPKPSQPASSAAGSTYSKLLDLISQEAGIGIEEMTDSLAIIECGVDSLMSLVISERCGKELSLEVKSSIFMDCPTFGDLREWIEASS